MPLTYDAFRECSVLGLVCLDKWVRLSALHVIELCVELHTHIPGPDRWIRHPLCRRHNMILMFYTTSESNKFYLNYKINLDRRTPTTWGDLGTTSDADLHFIRSSPLNSENSLYRFANH